MNDILDAINIHKSKSRDFGKFGSLELAMTDMGMTLRSVSANVSQERVNSRLETVVIEKLLSVAEDNGEVRSVIDINKTSIQIAKDARRGCGNVIIYNANDEDRFKSIKNFSYFVENVAGSGMMKFYQSTVPALEGSIIVLYRGRMPNDEEPKIYDGSPIMSVHTSSEAPVVIPALANPKTRYVGWYDKNAGKYVKVMRFK